MRVRTAQEHDFVGIAQSNVSDELAAAAQVAIVLLAQHRCADPVALTGVLVRHSRLPKAADLIVEHGLSEVGRQQFRCRGTRKVLTQMKADARGTRRWSGAAHRPRTTRL